MADIVVNGNTSGAVTLSAPAVAGTVTVTLPAASGTMLTTASSTGISGSAISSGTVPEAYGGTGTSTGYYGFKNRIINGAMTIDQRNAGASVTPSTAAPAYALDRFSFSVSQNSKCTIQQNAGSVTPPTGFSKYWGLTVGASAGVTVAAGDYFVLQQRIEGNNLADMAFGTTAASLFTISFWARSSLTGSFGFALQNGAQTRSYATTYTINTANTWEYKTITIPGDTTGTWATDNSTGLVVSWGLGIGSTYAIAAGNSWVTTSSPAGFGVLSTVQLIQTNSATFYITGVQLEKGSTATSFDYRPYGTELQLCKRYYDKTFAINTAPAQNAGRAGALESLAVRAAGASGLSNNFRFSVPMRTTPATVTFYNPSAANGQARNLDTSSDCTSTSIDNINEIGGKISYTLPTSTVSTNLVSIHWSADAEL